MHHHRDLRCLRDQHPTPRLHCNTLPARRAPRPPSTVGAVLLLLFVVVMVGTAMATVATSCTSEAPRGQLR